MQTPSRRQAERRRAGPRDLCQHAIDHGRHAEGHRSVTLHLLRAGADASVRVQNGMTALEYALKNKQTQLEKVLRCAESLKPGETFRERCE